MSRGFNVRCEACGQRSHRTHIHDDGSFVACGKCGGRVVQSEKLEDRQIARAKADLARFEATR